ncbi:MAG: thioredoxin family protein [Candidatus Krumholzibacteriia bacterium]|nr:thioredoxin family protein [bacterium]MCB9514227.1 thioredoxin family protein [Candidatus Latescibacterota bacterium]MCB9515896.1 thioredoxin family protein [Candidatus Latescibacterota bacterium]
MPRSFPLAALALALLGLTLPVLAGALEVGDTAPDFTLTDLAGKEHHLADYLEAGHVVVLEWFNPDCPFIKKHHEAHHTMDDTFADFAESGVVWLAINSGAPGKQGAGLERNQQAAKDYDVSFPILLDASGDVGRAYAAKTTPHMFVIDAKGIVRYDGAIDDAPNPGGDLGENYVAAALNQLLAGEDIAVASSKPYGCSVKYGDKG